jgi:pimeloyl-ACP methyl ester carboxylesterase
MMEEFFVSTPHGRLFARHWPADGRLAPIVLFHDSLGSVDLWRDFPARLSGATGRAVLAYDRLGFGRSDPRRGRLPRTFIADEALNLPYVCAKFAADRLVLFGHSVGGGMAVAAAAQFPSATAAVITEAAQVFVEDRTVAGIREAEAAFEHFGQFDRLRRHHGENAEWVLEAWTETWLSPDFAGWTLDDPLRRLRCPILAIHGENDEYGSVAHPRRIGELCQERAQTLILGECAHVPHREKPDEVLQAVADFLRSVA